MLDLLGFLPPKAIHFGPIRFRDIVLTFTIVAFLHRLAGLVAYRLEFTERETSKTEFADYIGSGVEVTWCLVGLIALPPAVAGIIYQVEKPVLVGYYYEIATFYVGLLVSALFRVDWGGVHAKIVASTNPNSQQDLATAAGLLGDAGQQTPGGSVVSAVADAGDTSTTATQITADSATASAGVSQVPDPAAKLVSSVAGVFTGLMDNLVQLLSTPLELFLSTDGGGFLQDVLLLSGNLLLAYLLRSAAHELRKGFFKEFWDYKVNFVNSRSYHAPGTGLHPCLSTHGPYPYQYHEPALPYKQAKLISELPEEWPIELMVEKVKMHERAGEAARGTRQNGGGEDVEVDEEESGLMSGPGVWLRSYVQENSRIIPHPTH